jgi:hypothetical protein
MTSVPRSSQTFHQEVNSRRTTFTPQELGFLMGLIVDGTDEEIARATERVSDGSLFAVGESHDEAGDESSRSFGSDRRRQSLALRRQSQVHTQIWKAHEGGLALSKQSSRRSLMVRSGSSSSIRIPANKSGTGSFHSSLNSSGFDALNDKGEGLDDDAKDPAFVPDRRGSLVVRRRASSIFKKTPQLAADARRRSALRVSSTGGRPSNRASGGAAGVAALRHSSQSQRSSCISIPEGHEATEGSPKHPATLWGSMQDDVEDKKISDEDLVASAQWAKQIQMRRASAGGYDGEGFEVGMFVQPVQEDGMVESESETIEEEEDGEDGLVKEPHHSLIMRRASVNFYAGEGMEIADWDAEEEEEMRRETLDQYHVSAHEHHPHSMAFFSEEPNTALNLLSASFDESQSLDREESFPQAMAAARVIQRSLSDDELSSMLTVNRGKYK